MLRPYERSAIAVKLIEQLMSRPKLVKAGRSRPKLNVQAASYPAGDRLVGAGGCWECATVAEPAVCAARDGVLDAV
jgi:hypothetical protein